MRWTIERLVPGGDGLHRLRDGRVGFATGALPGDRIEVLDAESKSGYVRARKWRLLTAGADRVTPPCPVAERCGGCDWMALARPAQLSHKVAIVRDALTRVGRLSPPETIEIVSAGPELRYRNRLRLHIDRRGRLGLFSRGTRQLVEIPGCPVCDPRIDEAVARMRAIVAGRPDALAPFEAVEIRCSPNAPEIALTFARREAVAEFSADTRALLGELRERYAVDAGDAEPPTQRWRLPGGVELEAPTRAFTQVNWTVNERLVSAVVEGALARGVSRFCDLYAGAGNFALALLARGIDGVAIEESDTAVLTAERAAVRQGLTRGRFVQADVMSGVRALLAAAERFDLVVADPPRAGARSAVPLIARLEPRELALCSCDPPTLARDLRELVDSGYVLGAITAFDMFPQTHHVEVLVWMSRR